MALICQCGGDLAMTTGEEYEEYGYNPSYSTATCVDCDTTYYIGVSDKAVCRY